MALRLRRRCSSSLDDDDDDDDDEEEEEEEEEEDEVDGERLRLFFLALSFLSEDLALLILPREDDDDEAATRPLRARVLATPVPLAPAAGAAGLALGGLGERVHTQRVILSACRASRRPSRCLCLYPGWARSACRALPASVALP